MDSVAFVDAILLDHVVPWTILVLDIIGNDVVRDRDRRHNEDSMATTRKV